MSLKRRREVVVHPEFRENLRYWVKTDRRTALRIIDLVEAILKDPFVGIGKPEPLRFVLERACSRRVTQEHRLVYQVGSRRVEFLQCRYHY